MKGLFLPLVILLMYSCNTTHQLAQFSGRGAIQGEGESIVWENDTARITYRLGRFSKLLEVEIYNKLPLPLEVNWKRSALVVDEKAIALYHYSGAIGGSVSLDSQRALNPISTGTHADFLGNFHTEATGQFIPPRAYIRKYLGNVPLRYVKTAGINEQPAIRTNVYSRVGYRQKRFTEEASPLRFRSYLTFRIGEEGKMQEWGVDHQFYATGLLQTLKGRYHFPKEATKKENVVSLMR